ncbi:intermembrane lipid transfer protein Vps13D [Condylostylus longicornis]|uniref:intermembrane lipid transfer protein Vps13D n=1 Tax=Condylostylus longicornis TaxID=2530218 RepID=UPI00244DE230|nr:intermembrane lipid transfer protein Vps13D [Condylostylus longicornis]
MLRELIAWVLNTYLGKYLEDFNPQQLSVALLSGEVELENVPLRKNAFNGLGLPLQILSGCVGKIKLQVPVRAFRSAPWCIIIERLYIVIGPKNLEDWDDEKEKKYDLEYKLSRLDDVEAKFRAQKEINLENNYYASSYSGWLSYGSGLATNIIENLQLKIKDVHIRYEDSISIPNFRFACGVTINSLTAQSCDSNWNPGFNSSWSQNLASFKLVELQSFAFYWDRLTNDTTFGDCEADDLSIAVQIASQDKTHRYIIQPISAKAHFKQDRSETPLRTRNRPRLSCEVTVNQIHLSLTDFQYSQIIESFRGLNVISRLHTYRILRPSCSVKDNPKKWWHYAVKCHGYEFESFEKKIKKCGENIRYIKIYTRIVANPNENLSAEDKEFKTEVEKCRKLEELKQLREICFFKLTLENDVQTASKQSSMLFQWFPMWWGWYGSSATNGNLTATSPTDLVNENGSTNEENDIEDDILNALEENNPIDGNSLLKRDAVFGKFNFVLISGQLNICSEDIQSTNYVTMMEMNFDNLRLDFETRPRSNSHLVELSMGSVCVRDLLTKDSVFPELIKPQNKEDHMPTFARYQSQKTASNIKKEQSSSTLNNENGEEPWFQLQYERKPLVYNTDYRLAVKTKSLDIVYNVEAVKWLTEFFMNPLQVANAKQKLEQIKYSTKMKLIKNWKSMLEGDLGQRKFWSLEIDIAAPQILFIENFCNRNTTIVIVDFGHFKLLKNATKDKIRQSKKIKNGQNGDVITSPGSTCKYDQRESEEEDAFMTPCSTPPGSEKTGSDSPTVCSNIDINPEVVLNENTGLENAFHDKIYDKYIIDLTDLQVLVCKSKERWNFASSKGSSALHILDRFSIALQLERRVINTIDPEYPSLTLFGTLPKLVAHVSEQKILALTDILNIINYESNNVLTTQKSIDFMTEKTTDEILMDNVDESIEDENQKSLQEQLSLIVIQFVIDQLSLEVQSRGRSVAELQVTGVRAALSKLGEKEINLSLSVHGLLLVDAIQSFGQDFELLIASHRHVGMDSVSGSLKQSEPCSPTSPGSPDPLMDRRPTSPQAITKAISTLQRDNSASWSHIDDLDALITMEINFIQPDLKNSEQLRIANINFNNLDIIANQETIVELLGFINRVFPSKKHKSNNQTPHKIPKLETIQKQDTLTSGNAGSITNEIIRTEITFDFNRLNVLVVRALMRDSFLVGRKVGTFTLSEAKIHAIFSSGSQVSVEGSLGGLQILDLTPEGINHQRIVSVGKDPLTEPPPGLSNQDLLSSLTQEIYGNSNHSNNSKEKLRTQLQALSFKITRDITATVNIQIRMASVWYTHCARFVQELNWCATEFKHYLKIFAKSIREKATDMAYGLVQPINNFDENVPYNQPTESIITEHEKMFSRKIDSPRKIKNNKNFKKVTIKLDILLDTPVLVVPRSSCSAQVLVAHLGKIIVSNYQQDVNIASTPCFSNLNKSFDETEIFTIDEDDIAMNHRSSEFLDYANVKTTKEFYMIDVKNVNLFSLDTSKRKGFRLSALPRAEEFYSCQSDAVAILHDTAIRLEITKYTNGNDILNTSTKPENNNIFVEASVTQTLQISLSRKQYEQVLETIENLFKIPSDLVRPPPDVSSSRSDHIALNTTLDNSSSPFELETQRLSQNFSFVKSAEKVNDSVILPRISFTLPIFVIRLKNEHENPLIDIVFREFSVQYQKITEYETSLEVSLRSILMEDLLCPIDSKYRQMVKSSRECSPQNSEVCGFGAGLSCSCPDLAKLQIVDNTSITGSLPDNLEIQAGFANTKKYVSNRNVHQPQQQQRRPSKLNVQPFASLCPETPPPSPQPKGMEDNLVIYSSFIVDPNCTEFQTRYKSMAQTSSIDFNSLGLVICVERWFLLLDFFGLFSEDENEVYKNEEEDERPVVKEISKGNSELEITVRSLNLTLVRNDEDLAKANVSNAFFVVSKSNHNKIVEGRLGSVSLYDLTPFGKVYRERFLTSGSEALNFIYKRHGEKHNQRTLNKDARLNITMSSVRYVHTKRFIMEIQEFIKEFLQLQTTVMKKIKSTETRLSLHHQRPTQLGLEINAGSPIIILPLSFDSNQLIVADLGEFSLKNSFRLSSEKDIITKKSDINAPHDEILDVMQVDLLNTNLFTGERICKKFSSPDDIYKHINDIDNNKKIEICLDMGGYWITKQSKSLLKEKCHLKLQIERNMDTWKSHNCPDVSVQGILSRVECVLDLEQYKLIRGFLAYNLGEPINDVYTSFNSFSLAESRLNLNVNDDKSPQFPDKLVWTNLSINLDLEDVLVMLNWSPNEFTSGIVKDNLSDFTQLNSESQYDSINEISFQKQDFNYNFEESLACINFIKSCLKIDCYSDGSQDIDLVSQEILVTDSRFDEHIEEPYTEPMGPKNVFTNILQPIRMGFDTDIVQAEIHSRKRNDHSKFTILLNNMRLMAIIDWIENIRDYISQSSDPPPSELRNLQNKIPNLDVQAEKVTPFELILNITDSELVLVEKTDQLDTNAVILKSTTVVSYKPQDNIKPMSVNLNHLEVFSCVLGYEDETALSIIDPITVNMDLKNQQIEIQMQKQFCIRLSYHDVKMFTRMFQSLPKQTRKAQIQQNAAKAVDFQQQSEHSNSAENQEIFWKDKMIAKLQSLGYEKRDCITALELSNNQLNDSAMWLLQNRFPVDNKSQKINISNDVEKSNIEVNSILINAHCISIFVIDDCKDADVPLLELSLSQLNFTQELNKYMFSSQSAVFYGLTTGFCRGHLDAVIASDYYNRHLSGWEPIIEPWECSADWNYSKGRCAAETNRLNLNINSEKLLKFNVTTTLIELWQLVRNNWTQDYYEGFTQTYSSASLAKNAHGIISTPIAYRRRTPFVPFSLKNSTGAVLRFKILLTQPGGITRTEISCLDERESQWIKAEPNEIIPFSFGAPNKLRHMDSHKSNLHQIQVHIDGWTKVGPVSIDRVGIFFRQARRESSEFPDMPKCRIVFAVTLEGSAQKLIVVRSSLRAHNKLEDTIMVKMDHPFHYMGVPDWPQAKTALINPKEIFNVPLSHSNASLYFKPIYNLISAIDEKNGNFIVSPSSDTKQNMSNTNGNETWNNQSKRNSTSYGNGNGKYFQFCDKSVNWRDIQEEIFQEQRICKGNRDKFYNIIVAVRRDGYPQKDGIVNLPGHTIKLVPPLRIYNLLCCDLLYKISNIQGRLQPSQKANIQEINLDEPIQLNISLDGYKVSGQLLIPPRHVGTVEPKLRLMDLNNRDLHLSASIYANKGNGIEIFISAPFWLVNKTGLPLVFRQEGAGHAASGQFEEHEKARVVSPLMFSFSDTDASPALQIRLGNRYGENSPWCQGLSLHKEIIHRHLKAPYTNETFVIGVEVRRGRGRYSRTSVVTFSPRFQLYNRSSHKLQFAQKCSIEDAIDPNFGATIIDAVPGCHFPFHWPKSDKEQLLCVRFADNDTCCWSSGIPINEAQSLYINCRSHLGEMRFLRLEVVLQGATYFLLFGDANTLPPPIRIDNFSEVPIKFFQYGCKQWPTTVKPHSSISYALDDPMGSKCIQVEAPGGDSYVYSLRDLNVSNILTYSNFIYIAFKETFTTPSISENLFMATEFEAVGCQHLVLGVRDKKVVLMRKCAGDRSQLWLMNSNEQLEHEGSSPPTEPGRKTSNLNPRLVLDLEKAPNPNDYTPLVVRTVNKQRESTQTWKFTNNRLMCRHANMCVQVRNGMFGLRSDSEAVLGRIESDTRSRTADDYQIPIEQAIERQKLRPGSGQLKIIMRMDGPIKTIQIRDVQSTSDAPLNPDPLWKHASHVLPTYNKNAMLFTIGNKTDFIDDCYIKINLAKGVGVSLVSRHPNEEIAYITLENILLETVATPYVRSIDLNVGLMQIDNQLLESPCPILLYTSKSSLYDTPPDTSFALVFNAKMLPSPNENAVIFERVVLSLKPFILFLEERFILRSAYFFGLGESQATATALVDESEFEAQQIATKILAANAKRYYFENLQISPSQIRLSVITSSKLSPQLTEIKKKLGLKLIKFEDAVIDFDKFADRHHFETLDIYLRAIKNHYKNLIKWQAGSILGSVDFLGNPLGFANDLSEGVSGLIFEGSVKSLVQNVTHGLSNSTAKLTETLSDGLGRVVLDEHDHDTRQKILQVSTGPNTFSEHLTAGIKGLSFGLLGGATSIVKHTYEGAQTDGLNGFISGLGKGILGTVTKPIIGFLDLASETANAVRETSKSAHRILPERKRLPRCTSGAPGGLLPRYSYTQAKGQQHLYLINKRNFTEQLMSYEPNLFDDRDSKLRLLVSTEYVRIFSRTEEETTIILQFHLKEVLSCHPVTVNKNEGDAKKIKRAQYYVEISSNVPNQSKRPRVRCQTEEMAEKASRQINYAKSVYDEREQSLYPEMLE